MNRITETNWLQKEHASSLHDGGLLSLFHVTYVWGKLGHFAATLLKGAHVQVEGAISSREYVPQNGDSAAKRTIAEVRVTSIIKLDRAKETTEERSPRRPESKTASRSARR